MNLKFRENNILNNYFFWKPTNLFWFFSFIAFLIWIFLGPIAWRHVDDFGPIHEYLTNDFSFKSWKFFIKDRLIAGWGSYPPIWTIWQILSLPFSYIGINQARYILLIQGFLSTLLTAYLTTCLSLNLYTNISQNNKYQINKIRYFIEILSISLNCFNPEIMFHASSNMPYNLPAITTISLLLLLFPCNYKFFEKSINCKKIIFTIPSGYFLILCFLTLFLGFQTVILFLAFLITYTTKIIFLNKDFYLDLNKIIYNTSQKFLKINKKFIFVILFLSAFLILSYFYKFTFLLSTDTKAGNWSSGIDNIYNLNILENDFRSWIIKTINNTSSIIGLSLYPLKKLQAVISYILSIPLLFGFLILLKKNKYLCLFALNTLLVFLITITLTSFDKFIYTPTRHTIFLYPYIWLVLIISLLDIFVYFEVRFQRISYLNLFNLSLGIFLFYSIGLSNSHELIQYTRGERDKLVELAKKADYQINLSFSFFPSHGSEEFKASRLEECDPRQNYNKLKFFIYSHRNFGMESFSNNYLKNILINNTKGCITKNDKIRVIEKIESYSKFDIEQNNNIYNGGSSIYAYLIEVDLNN